MFHVKHRAAGTCQGAALSGRDGRGKPALPRERVRDNRVEIVELRLPAEQGANTLRAGHDRSRIAGPPLRQLDLEILAGDALDRIDHLQDRVAASIAAIERRAYPAVAQVAERGR